MIFNNPIPRSGLPNFHESSRQRSLRDADALEQQWKKNTVPTRQIGQLTRNVSSLSRQVNQMRRRILPGYVPALKAPAPMHPFKIYQPTNYASFAAGIAFLDPSSGVGSVCNIDATKPTDFTAIPPTVNPTTDAWRFWAVRTGDVEVRPLYSSQDYYGVDGTNWGVKLTVENNADGVFIDYAEGYDAPTTDTNNPPLIIPDAPGGNFLIGMALWIQITPDASGADYPSAAIAGCACFEGFSPQWSLYPGFGNGMQGPNMVPIGIVYANGLSDTNPPWYLGVPVVKQELFDHAINRYSPGTGNFMVGINYTTTPRTNYMAGGAMNFRGVATWDKVSAYDCSPTDLEDQVFYPGDVINVYGPSGDVYAEISAGVVLHLTSVPCVLWMFTGCYPAGINFRAGGLAPEGNWTPISEAETQSNFYISGS